MSPCRHHSESSNHFRFYILILDRACHMSPQRLLLCGRLYQPELQTHSSLDILCIPHNLQSDSLRIQKLFLQLLLCLHLPCLSSSPSVAARSRVFRSLKCYCTSYSGSSGGMSGTATTTTITAVLDLIFGLDNKFGYYKFNYRQGSWKEMLKSIENHDIL